MFWDSRVSGTLQTGFVSPAGEMLPAPSEFDSTLAVLAMFPATAPDEMRGLFGDEELFGRPNELALLDAENFTAIWAGLMQRLLAIPEYERMFNEAYPETPTAELGFQHAANAIAAFISDSFTFDDSPFDRYVAGDDGALSHSQKRGALLFYGEANCAQCHTGNLFTDQEHYNVAIPQLGPGQPEEAPLDFGRFRETDDPADRFAFRTPPLRNVALTGPWTHSGAYTTLEAAVRHMLYPEQALRSYDESQLRADLRNSVQDDEATLDLMLETLDPLVRTPVNLSDQEVDRLVDFLNALTDPAAVDLDVIMPAAVPSGLPMDR